MQQPSTGVPVGPAAFTTPGVLAMTRLVPRWLPGLAAGALVLAAGPGCQTAGGPPSNLLSSLRGSGEENEPKYNPAPKADAADSATLPKELNTVTMPPYIVRTPDILLIDSPRLIPLPPYRVEPLDTVYLVAPETKGVAAATAPELVVDGPYTVDPDGTINLGPTYGGPIRVADLTIPEIEKVVEARLKTKLAKGATGAVSASLAQARGAQSIRGEHLVQPDGTVALGLYGSVYVAGMTTPQVKQAIEAHLARYLLKPEVSVTVTAFNSSFYYVITDFAGSGEQVVRIPHTGNETVLDAISLVGGLSAVSSKRIWVARPAPAGVGDQILPVDWKGITRRGHTATNYQILPGDRVFVMGQPLTKVDATLARTLAPVERGLSTVLLGSTTYQTLRGNGFGLGTNNGSGTVVNVAPTTATTTTGR